MNPREHRHIDTMSRSGSFSALLALAAFATVLLGTSSASIAGTCQDKLVGNSYDCIYVFNFGQSGNTVGIVTEGNCVKFVNRGPSTNFSMVGVLGSLSSKFGCACQTTGGIYSSDLSPDAYECVGDSAGNIVQFHGKVDSGGLQGQASEENGTYIVFDCGKTSACD